MVAESTGGRPSACSPRPSREGATPAAIYKLHEAKYRAELQESLSDEARMRVQSKLALLLVWSGDTRSPEHREAEHLADQIEASLSVYMGDPLLELSGADERLVLEGTVRLAKIWSALGRWAKALDLCEKVAMRAECCLRHNSPNGPAALTCLQEYAELQQKRGKLRDAELTYRHLVAHLEARGEPAEAGRQLARVAAVLAELGDPEQAEHEARRALDLAEAGLGPADPDLSLPLNALAAILKERGKVGEAERTYQRSLFMQEAGAGGSEECMAAVLCSLGDLAREDGRLEEAVQSFHRCLLLRTKVLGRDHELVMEAWQKLGVALCENGEYVDAEEKLREAVRIWELGGSTDDDASCLRHLAACLRNAGKRAAAVPVYRRLVESSSRREGPESSAVAVALNNLGSILAEVGDHAEAGTAFERALEIREAMYGPDHVAVAVQLNTLARHLLHLPAKWPAAEQLFRRVFSMASVERQHPAYLAALSSLGELLRKQGGAVLEEAMAVHRERLAIAESAFGPQHTEVAVDLNHIGTILKQQGKFAESIAVYRRALSILQQELGSEHFHVATALNNLGSALNDNGDYPEAEAMFWKSLAIVEKNLGGQHRNVASCLNNLGVLLNNMGRGDEAIPLVQRSLDINEGLLGPRNPALVLMLNNLGGLMRQQGRLQESEDLFLRAAAIYREAHAGQKPGADLATVLNNLGALLSAAGRHAEAQPAFQESLMIRQDCLGPDHALTQGTREWVTYNSRILADHSIGGRPGEASPRSQTPVTPPRHVAPLPGAEASPSPGRAERKPHTNENRSSMAGTGLPSLQPPPGLSLRMLSGTVSPHLLSPHPSFRGEAGRAEAGELGGSPRRAPLGAGIVATAGVGFKHDAGEVVGEGEWAFGPRRVLGARNSKGGRGGGGSGGTGLPRTIAPLKHAPLPSVLMPSDARASPASPLTSPGRASANPPDFLPRDRHSPTPSSLQVPPLTLPPRSMSVSPTRSTARGPDAFLPQHVHTSTDATASLPLTPSKPPLTQNSPQLHAPAPISARSKALEPLFRDTCPAPVVYARAKNPTPDGG